STPEQWAGDECFQGGYWMLVDIDLAKICSAPVRLNISLPEYLVRQIDDYAKAHHQTRSGFLARAAEEAMRARWAAPTALKAAACRALISAAARPVAGVVRRAGG